MQYSAIAYVKLLVLFNTQESYISFYESSRTVQNKNPSSLPNLSERSDFPLHMFQAFSNATHEVTLHAGNQTNVCCPCESAFAVRKLN
jgi:hypothetical protein